MSKIKESAYRLSVLREKCHGHWLTILSSMAPELESACKKPGKHIPCPVHGGKDGFRLFRDANETGGGVCNTCGKFHDGFAVLQWINKKSFLQVYHDLENYFQVSHESPPERFIPPCAQVFRPDFSKREKFIEETWKVASWKTDATLQAVSRYLRARAINFPVKYLPDMGFLHVTPFYRNGEKKYSQVLPAIVCAVRNDSGRILTLHRTYLSRDCSAKAAVDSPRKLMPSVVDRLSNCAIRFGEPDEGILGVAEGIETALSCYQQSGIPCWSLINTTLMKSFTPPQGVHTVLIWADRDLPVKTASGEIIIPGIEAAKALKERLLSLHINAYILLPREIIPPGKKSVDWNDVLVTGGKFPDPDRLRDFLLCKQAS